MNILKYLTDTAILWATTGSNGYGELTFSSAVELPVRWEDRSELFVNADGKEMVSRAVIHVNQDVVPDSFMCLGELTDLSAAQKLDPKLVTSAFAVKAFKKLKSVSGRYILRKVYLFGGDVKEGPIG